MNVNEEGRKLSPGVSSPNEGRIDLSGHPTPLEARILKNFYLSFKFSQGNGGLQRNMLAEVARMYRRNGLLAGYESADELIGRITPRIERLQLPSNHAIYDASGSLIKTGVVKAQFEIEWKELSGMLNILIPRNNPNIQNPDIDKDLFAFRKDVVVKIAEEMLEEDAIHVGKGRKSAKKGEDPHESFVETYVVKGKPTGSEEFDKLFEEVKRVLFFSSYGISQGFKEPELGRYKKINLNLTELRSVWERKHPGQQFAEPVAA